MTTPNEALLPCPFCGGDDVAVSTLKGHFCVQCACEANGPWKQTPASAEIAWNNRAAIALPAEPAAQHLGAMPEVAFPPLRPGIVNHPKLGELTDTLGVQLYAMGYAQAVWKAAKPPPVAGGTSEVVSDARLWELRAQAKADPRTANEHWFILFARAAIAEAIAAGGKS